MLKGSEACVTGSGSRHVARIDGGGGGYDEQGWLAWAGGTGDGYAVPGGLVMLAAF